jgi:hypothetical protein
MRERRPGVWQIRICAGRDPATRRFRYVTRTVQGGKRNAQRAAAKLVSAVEVGLLPAARGTVAQLLEQWMAHIESQGRAPSTSSRGLECLVAPRCFHASEHGPARGRTETELRRSIPCCYLRDNRSATKSAPTS